MIISTARVARSWGICTWLVCMYFELGAGSESLRRNLMTARASISNVEFLVFWLRVNRLESVELDSSFFFGHLRAKRTPTRYVAVFLFIPTMVGISFPKPHAKPLDSKNRSQRKIAGLSNRKRRAMTYAVIHLSRTQQRRPSTPGR